MTGNFGGSARVLRVLFAILFFLSALRASAGNSQIVNTEPGSGISITVESPFNQQPMGGCVPLRVKILNRSSSGGSWDFEATSPGEYGGNRGGNAIQSHFTVQAGAGEEREFDFLVPTAVPSNGYYLNNAVRITCTGHGIANEAIFFSASRGGGYRRIGTIGFSEKLAGKSSADLSKELQTRSIDPVIFSIDLALLPPDWRVLAVFDQIWLTAGEWDALPAATRLAFEQWVASGGILIRCAPGVAESEESFGLGKMRHFPLFADGDLGITTTADRLISLGAHPQENLAGQYKGNWPDKSLVPGYTPNSPLLIGVIILFGILVGPINFFVLCGREKRHRIFALTPLISLLGAAIIGLTILVQDGLGGWGRRLALILVLPEKNLEIIQQEQVARTGVLLSSGFDLDPTALMIPLILDDRQKQYIADGSHYSGSWFASRAVQGQFLTAVRPSRARIELQNPAEVAAGQPPRLVSSISANLDALFYVNADGAVFSTGNVSPGRPVTLEKSNSSALWDAFAHQEFDLTGPRLKQLARLTNPSPGWFYAAAHAPRGVMLETLRSLDWRRDRVFYLGPVVDALTPGEVEKAERCRGACAKRLGLVIDGRERLTQPPLQLN